MKNLFSALFLGLILALTGCQDEEPKLSAADQADLEASRAESGSRLFAEEPAPQLQQQKPQTFDEAVQYNTEIDMKYYDQLCGGLRGIDKMQCYERYLKEEVSGEAFKQKLAVESQEGRLPAGWKKYYMKHIDTDRTHAKCQQAATKDLMRARDRLYCTVTEYNWLSLYIELWGNGQWKDVLAMQTTTRSPMADIKETNSEQYVGD